MTVKGLFKAAAEEVVTEMGGSLTVIKQRPLALKLEFPDGISLCTHGTHVPLNSRATSKIMIDKELTGSLLESENIHSPRTHFITLNAANFPNVSRLKTSKEYQRITAFIDKVGYPVFVKSNKGSQGRHVHRIDNRGKSNNLLVTLVQSKNEHFLIQEACFGTEYRIIAIRGRIQLALEKRPLGIIGDGENPIGKLIRKELRALRNKGRKVAIKSDATKIKTHLARQDMTLASVPEKGQHVTVLANKNLSDGGTPNPCTAEIAVKYTALCEKICRRLNVEYSGIDLIEDTRKNEIRPYIIELNGSPGYGHFVRSAPEHAEMVRQVFVAAFRAAYQKQKEAERPNSSSAFPSKDPVHPAAKAA